MAASNCVHDGRTEITDDEPPRSPNEKGDQEKSEPKRDTPPYTWHRPIAAKSKDRKEQGDDCTQCSEKHRILPPPNIGSSYLRRRFGYGRWLRWWNVRHDHPIRQLLHSNCDTT